MLKAGMQAPHFEIKDNSDGKISLSDYLGQNLVLYFYPKADTPGCTIESKDFASSIEKFKKLNCSIIGISRDSVKANHKFSEKHCLPFPLGCDLEGDVCQKYGVWVEKSMYGKKYMGIQRTTLFIDKNGIIKGIWHKVNVEGHVEEILNFISKQA
jgi:peroxiredoxin Q/BCP